MKLSLYLCSHSSLAALLSACGTPTCVNVIATHSGFPQDVAVLKMIWVHVRKVVGEGGGENGERENQRNFECVFWERNLNVWRGQKL